MVIGEMHAIMEQEKAMHHVNALLC